MSYISREIRQRVTGQANHRCGYCLTQEMVVGTPMEIDHLIPSSLGGTDDEQNLWLACSLCNDHKGDRIAGIDPLTGEMARLFNPREQKWTDHFAWSPDSERILGLTPEGRATVVTLNLNRASLVLARRAWVAVGWHPPKDKIEPGVGEQ